MFFLVLALVLALLAYATWCDLATREIPDWISIAIAILGFGASILGWLGPQFHWWLALSGGLVASAVGVGLFYGAQFGGGDAKLIGSLGLLLGPAGVIIFLVLMAISGGLLAVIALLRKQRDYAYVPAITIGYTLTVVIIPWVQK